jgi:hypothetical protein
MTLTQTDIELIEHILYKNSDDTAVSITRSLERLEDRIDVAEARIYARISNVEDRIETVRQDVADELGEMKDEIRDFVRSREKFVFE